MLLYLGNIMLETVTTSRGTRKKKEKHFFFKTKVLMLVMSRTATVCFGSCCCSQSSHARLWWRQASRKSIWNLDMCSVEGRNDRKSARICNSWTHRSVLGGNMPSQSLSAFGKAHSLCFIHAWYWKTRKQKCLWKTLLACGAKSKLLW